MNGVLGGVEQNLGYANRTACPENPITTADIVFFVYKYFFIGILTLLCIPGNILVIASLIRCKHLRCPSLYFILSLACSDLMSGFTYPLYNISHVEVRAIKETLGKWSVCRLMVIGITLPQTASAYNLVLITVTRLIAVKWPLKFHDILTHRKCIGAVTCVWIVAVSISASLYWRPEPDGYCGVCRYEVTYDFSQIIALLAVVVIVPLILMLILYAIIAYIMHNHGRRICSRTYHNAPSPNHLTNIAEPNTLTNNSRLNGYKKSSKLANDQKQKQSKKSHHEFTSTTSSTSTSNYPAHGRIENTTLPHQETQDNRSHAEEQLIEVQIDANSDFPGPNQMENSYKLTMIESVTSPGSSRVVEDQASTVSAPETTGTITQLAVPRRNTEPDISQDVNRGSELMTSQHHVNAEMLRLKYLKLESRLMKVVIFLLGYYTFAWLPIITYIFVEMACSKCLNNRYLGATTRILLYSNSSVNVFIYAGRHSGFRNAFRRQIRAICCWPGRCRRRWKRRQERQERQEQQRG